LRASATDADRARLRRTNRFASSTAFVVGGIGWPAVFVATALAALLALLAWLQRRGHFDTLIVGRMRET
jgi:hypothetical protein